jgi:hypothetical protein
LDGRFNKKVSDLRPANAGEWDIITLPVDGQLIRARATRPTLDKADTAQSVDAEAVELVE